MVAPVDGNIVGVVDDADANTPALCAPDESNVFKHGGS
jgi:hypothetical protein